jgi:hypothetical protein
VSKTLYRYLFVFQIRTGLDPNSWIRIHEGKLTHKKEKNEEFSCFEVLDVLYGGGGGRGAKPYPKTLKPIKKTKKKKNHFF